VEQLMIDTGCDPKWVPCNMSCCRCILTMQQIRNSTIELRWKSERRRNSDISGAVGVLGEVYFHNPTMIFLQVGETKDLMIEADVHRSVMATNVLLHIGCRNWRNRNS
jgi:hypothetical protein